MQGKDVEAFKNLMRNYQFNLDRVNKYQMQIEDCYAMLGAVPQSIDFAKVKTHSLPNKDFEYMLRDNIQYYKSRLDFYNAQIKFVNEKLNLMPVETRNMASDMFILGETEISVASRYFISPSGMRKRINKAIKKVLED